MSKTGKSLVIILLSFIISLSSSAESYPALKASTASAFSNTWYYVFWPVNLVLPHLAIKKTIYEVQTQYNHIKVYEDDNAIRYLVFLPENGYQSVYDSESPDKLVSNYAKYTFLALSALRNTPKRVLFVGMGGAIMPTYFRRYYSDTQIDIVELDGNIPAIAEKYFGFIPDSKTSVFIEDGRKYIDETKEKYDIIFLDVYDAETIPPQFTTTEFFARVKQCLACDGVLSINLANLGDEFVSKICQAVASEFPNTCYFLTSTKSNYILISSADKNIKFSDIEKQASLLDSKQTFNISFTEMLKSRVLAPF